MKIMMSLILIYMYVILFKMLLIILFLIFNFNSFCLGIELWCEIFMIKVYSLGKIN